MPALYVSSFTRTAGSIQDIGWARREEDISSEPLAIAWAIGEGDAEVWDLATGADIPPALFSSLQESFVEIWTADGAAAQSEVSLALGLMFRPGRFSCFSARAGAAGLPHDLDAACSALRIGANRMRRTGGAWSASLAPSPAKTPTLPIRTGSSSLNP